MRQTERVHVHALCAVQRYLPSVPRQETQAGPRERLSFSLEGEGTSQGPQAALHLTLSPSSSAGHQRVGTCAPASASSHLTPPAEGEWDASFDCSSLDPCSTPALSSNARSRCPVTQIHTEDKRRCKTQEGSQSIPQRSFCSIMGCFHTFC